MYIFGTKGARRGCKEGETYGCNFKLKYSIDFGLGWFINIFTISFVIQLLTLRILHFSSYFINEILYLSNT